MKLEVTNEDRYLNVVDIELHLRKQNGVFVGDVSIETTDHPLKTWSGEHGSTDYESEYGFRII